MNIYLYHLYHEYTNNNKVIGIFMEFLNFNIILLFNMILYYIKLIFPLLTMC